MATELKLEKLDHSKSTLLYELVVLQKDLSDPILLFVAEKIKNSEIHSKIQLQEGLEYIEKNENFDQEKDLEGFIKASGIGLNYTKEDI